MRTLFTVLTLAAAVAPAARAQVIIDVQPVYFEASKPAASPPVTGAAPVASAPAVGTAPVVSALPPAGPAGCDAAGCSEGACCKPGWMSRLRPRFGCTASGCEAAPAPCAAPVIDTSCAAPTCDKPGWFSGLRSRHSCTRMGCDTAPADCGGDCGPHKGCRTCGRVFGRLGGWFGGCRPGLGGLFRDKAYRPSAFDCVPPRCCHHGAADGTVPHTGPVFPAGHMLGAMPTGLPGPSVR